jgi:FkbM family methyltransferase
VDASHGMWRIAVNTESAEMFSRKELARAQCDSQFNDAKGEFRIGFCDYIGRLLSARVAKWLAGSTPARNSAQISCFPRDYIGMNIVANGYYEELTLRFLFEVLFKCKLAEFSKGTVLDVGANIGNHSCYFASRFNQVIGFEPNPICIRLFEANMLMNQFDNVELCKFALSDRNNVATLQLNLSGNIGGSRLTEPTNREGERFIAVQLRRGDELLVDDLRPSGRIELVKLDVEGHEHQALLGLENAIKTDKPLIMFESSGAQGPSGSHAILATLSRWGYQHTYVVRADIGLSRNRVMRVLQRIISGYRLRAVEVEQPEDRYHALIVASPNAL